MIVSEIMTTKLVTVTPDDTLSHAANLLRQYQFHHLPVVRATTTVETLESDQKSRKTLPVLEGLLTSQDIDMAASLGTWSSSDLLHQPWQERRVLEMMHRATVRVSPTTSVAAAAQILVIASDRPIRLPIAIPSPRECGIPLAATMRLGTIQSATLLVRLQEAHI